MLKKAIFAVGSSSSRGLACQHAAPGNLKVGTSDQLKLTFLHQKHDKIHEFSPNFYLKEATFLCEWAWKLNAFPQKEDLVVLLAGPISHTNIQYMSKFSVFLWICLLFILLILMGGELPLCIIFTLS